MQLPTCKTHTKRANTSWQICFVLVAFIFTDALTWAQVYVEPNTALLNEGDRTELLCRYGQPITYCRIEVPNEKVLNLSPNWNKSPGFTYAGKGLEAGECGVSIERVKGINNGQVKCSVGVEGEEFSGVIALVVAIRPQQPIIELLTRPDRDLYFTEGAQFRARCIVRDGRPAANITWLLDDWPADKSVSQTEFLAAQGAPANSSIATTVQEIQWHLTAEDNNRKLICRSHHQTDRENVPPQEAAYTIHVRYPPVRRNEAVVYGLYLDHTALVNLTIRSNPAPIIEWTADGQVIPQGTQKGRFSAYEPVPLGQDYYNVTLAIAGLNAEDIAKTYQLRASNALGTTDYEVRISSSNKPPIAGLDVGAIVGIVVAIAVLILIVLLVVFAKVTNRWCFGEKSLKTAKPETSDTESADINAASTATTATTAAITDQQAQQPREQQQQQQHHTTVKENNNGKKSKGLELFNAIFKRVHEKYGEKRRGAAGVGGGVGGVGGETNDVEQARDGEEQHITIQAQIEQVPGQTNITAADNEPNNKNNKEDKQLVYAELILKPAAAVKGAANQGEDIKAPLTITTTVTPATKSTTVTSTTTPPTAKNATEYAEIVYVQKPSAELNKQT